jgi:Pvc16 N-terminal domain
MSTAIRDVSVTLKKLLTDRLGVDPEVLAALPPGGALTVSLNSPDDMATSPDQGISLWLYKVTRDDQTLNAPSRRVSGHRLRPAPLPLRLHYLLTPMFELDTGVAAPEFEQTALGKSLQLFAEEPILRPPLLVGTLAGEAQIAVRLEPLSTEEITRIWDALESNYKLSVSYEVTIAPIELRREILTGPPVGVIANSYGAAYAEDAP